MRIHDIVGEAAGVGKIIKGVNTTPDVHPGEIKKQSAKMCMTVDDNGRPPIANPDGSDAVKESISGNEMLDQFRAQHHDTPGLNKKMEKWVKSRDWSIKMISPDQLPDHYGDEVPNDPFNRTIDINDDRVNWYAHKIAAGQKIQPIIIGPNNSVIDGNHRATAARLVNKPIMAYVPINR